MTNIWHPDFETVAMLTEHGNARYSSKREYGISDVRSDGSIATAENDIQATLAEYFFVHNIFGRPFNNQIFKNTGDGGFDISDGLTIEVIWFGETCAHIPRSRKVLPCRLIVNPYEPHRHADVYVGVSGNLKSGYWFTGWTLHKKLMQYPTQIRNCAKYAMPVDKLYFSDLGMLRKDWPEMIPYVEI